jgi:hypothetical protein
MTGSAKQSILSLRGEMDCFAPLAMTAPGAHSRDPVARNDGFGCLKVESYFVAPANVRRDDRWI